MNIHKLTFKNFRNLNPGEITPAETINVICGENAQGKTNLIEALWLFTGGRSFRSCKDSDMVRFGERSAELCMDLYSQGRDQSIGLKFEDGARKVEINMAKRGSSVDLIGKFCAVIFSPIHLSLVKDGPSQRRRFLDAAICQLWPVYTQNLIKYNKIVNQRNALLKSTRKNASLRDTIDVWDESLARCAAEVTKKRLDYITLLRGYALSEYRGISSGAEEMSLQYRSILPREADTPASADDIAELYRSAFAASKDDDLALGFTTKGPHRDDLDIRVEGKPARGFSSQGQQRSVVLALKLAEAKIIGCERNEDPVILLDDVMSELDIKRQAYILNALGDMQVFITCCDPAVLSKMRSGKTFLLKKGAVT